VKIAICQILVIDSDREGNFRRIEYALAGAKSQGAQIAAFPNPQFSAGRIPKPTASPNRYPVPTVSAFKT
jgi:hypothetical protein